MKDVLIKQDSASFGGFYIVGVWVIYALMYVGFLTLSGVTARFTTETIAILSVLATAAPLLGSGVYNEEMQVAVRGGITKLRTGRVKSSSLFNVLIFNPEWRRSKTYYPEIQGSFTPILNPSVVFSPVVLWTGLVFALVIGYLSKNIGLAVGISLVGMMFSWVFYVLISIAKMKHLWQAWRSPQPSLVELNYSMKELEKKVNDQKFLYHEDEYKTKERIRSIVKDGVKAAHELNNLIVNNQVDTLMIANEIEIIEHAINTFIPETLTTINNYFAKHGDKREAAIKIYNRDMFPVIRSEVAAVGQKVGSVKGLIIGIKSKQLDLKARRDEESISVDEELARLVSITALPEPNFPEFHTLEFESIEKRVAASSIVSRSLKALVEAKKKLDDGDAIAKIDEQIDAAKSFVRSLAINTKESADRDKRLMIAEAKDDLVLNKLSGNIDDINNLISIEQRYIDAYDKTLPPSARNNQTKRG